MINLKWSEKEDAFLFANYDVLTVKEISSQLGRSYSAVCLRASRIGASCAKIGVAKKWSKEEVLFLVDNHKKPSLFLASCLGRTERSVIRKKCSLGLRNIDAVDLTTVAEAFKEKGWQLLSKKYINSHTKLRYICDKGHVYWITWNKFKERERCPKCYYDSYDFFETVKNRCKTLGYEVLSVEYIDSKTPLHFKCTKGHIFSMSWNSIGQGARCTSCFCSKKISGPEKDLASEVRGLVGACKVYDNVRSVIPPYELDIFVPSKKLAIEYCGLYWHSEDNGKDRNYHYNKVKMCHDVGIKLITVFEDEYRDKRGLVLDRVGRGLGICKEVKDYKNLSFSFGVDPIKFLRSESFLLKDHGLKYLCVSDINEEPLCVLSYKTVYGGVEIVSIDEGVGVRLLKDPVVFHILMKKLTEKYNPKIISYCIDLRWVNPYVGFLNAYGFKFSAKVEPQCSYIFKHRRVAKPSKLMDSTHLSKIWDCGYDKYCIITGG